MTDFLTLHELRLNDNEINAFPNAMSQLVSSLNTPCCDVAAHAIIGAKLLRNGLANVTFTV